MRSRPEPEELEIVLRVQVPDHLASHLGNGRNLLGVNVANVHLQQTKREERWSVKDGVWFQARETGVVCWCKDYVPVRLNVESGRPFLR